MGGYTGYGYNPAPVQKVNLTQTLSKDETTMLRARGQKSFNVMVTDEERIRAICNHKDPDSNNIALAQNADGTFTCTVCGERFSLLSNITRDEANCIADDYNDLVQTAKTFYPNLPNDAARSLYQTFAFIKKVPEFWEIAQEYAGKLNQNQNIVDPNHGRTGGFSMYHMLMNPSVGMGGQMPPVAQQPTYEAVPNPAMGGMGGYYGQAPVAPAPVMGAGMYGGMQTGTGTYDPGVMNPNDRPVGVVDPATNMTVSQHLSAGPSPMAAQSPTAATEDVKKVFRS